MDPPKSSADTDLLGEGMSPWTESSRWGKFSRDFRADEENDVLAFAYSSSRFCCKLLLCRTSSCCFRVAKATSSSLRRSFSAQTRGYQCMGMRAHTCRPFQSNQLTTVASDPRTCAKTNGFTYQMLEHPEPAEASPFLCLYHSGLGHLLLSIPLVPPLPLPPSALDPTSGTSTEVSEKAHAHPFLLRVISIRSTSCRASASSFFLPSNKSDISLSLVLWAQRSFLQFSTYAGHPEIKEGKLTQLKRKNQ
jgi:hypothetical protein